MPIHVDWLEIAVRLLCAVVCSALIGMNRSEHGRVAGLRTSILVCVAACVAMLQVNILLPLAGRPPNSFVMNDLMRLPLGILTGMGFIGGGAILRRDNFVVGVTTAATLWLLTVLGLCFGGGQIGLGIAGTALGLLILIGLKKAEDHMKQDHQGRLFLVTDRSGPEENEIRAVLTNADFQIASCGFASEKPGGDRELTYELRWRAKAYADAVPEVVKRLTQRAGVLRIEWTPQVR